MFALVVEIFLFGQQGNARPELIVLCISWHLTWSNTIYVR